MSCSSRVLAALAGMTLLLGVALSCASSTQKAAPAAELRAGVREVVADPVRATRMAAAVDELEATAGRLDALLGESHAAIVRLLRDYHSSRAAVESSLAEYNTKRDALAQRMLSAHAALKADATAPEWKKLWKLETEVLKSAATRSLGTESARKER